MALPPPPKSIESMMPKPGQRRSGIRTASGTLQEQFLERLRALRDDPTLAVPQAIGDEPAALAKLRRTAQGMAGGKVGLLARFDRGLVGAIAASVQLADQETQPRLMDAKVAGNRRFFLPRGHVDKASMLGVQNHDDPRCLLLAYTQFAKRHDLHFFAGDELWAAATPTPPQPWIERLADRMGVPLRRDETGWTCGHAERGLVVLAFQPGAHLSICGACGKKAGGLHNAVKSCYLGPNQRQPVAVHLRMPDGEEVDINRVTLARYRAGLDGEETILAPSLDAWRKEGGKGPRFLTGTIAHASQSAMLDAIGAEPWERTAIAAITQDGVLAQEATVASVLAARPERLAAATAAVLGAEATDFMLQRAGMAPRDLLRAAHQEGQRKAVTASLPEVPGLGPVGTFVDRVARELKAAGRPAALQLIRKAFEERTIGRSHLWALLRPLGGDLSLDVRFDHDEKHGGEGLVEPATAVLQTEGDAYRDALVNYLRLSGTGEA